ncbi:hypothetical protein EV184_101516 [Sinorhizobium americanum]|uniref:Uncharacterized protein n=1 Tax=Sinorhizobium americanum TaxID=194963 RepID=A0A4R2C901_9HYPH|nr:hypothetical protein EV184_101516 [Sinorhizobium americanum]
MKETTRSKDATEERSDELLRNYRPLAIKAVLAGCAVKREPPKPAPRIPEPFGPLPDGFHMPHEVDD